MINFNEKSTLRGIVWLVASLVSSFFLFSNDSERATVTLSLAATVSGALGLMNDS